MSSAALHAPMASAGGAVPMALTLPRVASAGTFYTSGTPHYMLGTSSSTYSMFGEQLTSQRKTAAAFSFKRYPTGRDEKGYGSSTELVPYQRRPSSRRTRTSGYDGQYELTDPLWRNEEFNRHHIPIGTPNPGQDGNGDPRSHLVAFGKQVPSKRRLAPSYGFGTSGRFTYLDRIEKARSTPGPGTYGRM